jgi:hypothetical protein
MFCAGGHRVVPDGDRRNGPDALQPASLMITDTEGSPFGLGGVQPIFEELSGSAGFLLASTLLRCNTRAQVAAQDPQVIPGSSRSLSTPAVTGRLPVVTLEIMRREESGGRGSGRDGRGPRARFASRSQPMLSSIPI